MQKPRPINGRYNQTNIELVGCMLTNEIKIINILNAGSFGLIYIGKNIKNNQKIAIKLIKNVTIRTGKAFVKEYRIMRTLNGLECFPWANFLTQNENKLNRNVLVMQKLGPNLYDLFKFCDRKFSLKTVINIMDSQLQILETQHSKSIVHRDIKPENFCQGGADLTNFYMIDFGLSKFFKNPNGEHKPLGNNKGFVGTPRYASRNAHLGLTQSRRDDLEALGYLVLFFLNGKLPWQNIKASGKVQKHNMLYQLKNNIGMDQLCESIPTEFQLYFLHIRHLGYEQKPDYQRLRSLFLKLAHKKGITIDSRFDWDTKQKVLFYCQQNLLIKLVS